MKMWFKNNKAKVAQLISDKIFNKFNNQINSRLPLYISNFKNRKK